MQEQRLSQQGRGAHIRSAAGFEKESVAESWRQGGATLQGARRHLRGPKPQPFTGNELLLRAPAVVLGE